MESSEERIVDRMELADLIVATRARKGLTWSEVADAVGASKEWVTAGCLGQMTFDAAQAATLVTLFELPTEALQLLQTPPYRGSLATSVPTDPLIYRFYELVSVYGTTFKELISEEFGDGIMSAIDFKMQITRETDPAGDRVNISMSGKFLPYKRY
jgi:cyanate lyase